MSLGVCMRGAASSCGLVGKYPPVRENPAPLAVSVSWRKYCVHGEEEGGWERETVKEQEHKSVTMHRSG